MAAEVFSPGLLRVGVLTSLVKGSTAAARRHRAAVAAADTADPPNSGTVAGVPTRGADVLHIDVQNLDGAITADWELWVLNETSGLWCKDTRSGTGGTVNIAASEASNNLIQVAGASRVYVKLENFSSGGGAGVNVWLSGIRY